MPNDATIPYEENPNNMIILLDKHIGKEDACIQLKKAFETTTDPKNETPVKLLDKDFNDILRNSGPNYIGIGGVWFLLKAFTDIEPCIQCFEQNQDKHIIFITSGSMGEIAVPRIFERFPDIFTDPDTNEPYSSIYVYCHNIEYQMHWVNDYLRYLQIFNHEADLLVRMIRDIADYFVLIGKRLLDEDPPNNAAAKHRLTWAHELYQRYSEMEKVSVRRELDEVNELLDGIDEDMKSSSDEDD